MFQKWIYAVFFLIFGFVTPIEASDDFEGSRIGTPHSQEMRDPEYNESVSRSFRAFNAYEEGQNKHTWVRTGGEVLLTGAVVCGTLYGIFFVCAFYCVAQLSNSMSGGHADTFEIFTELLKDFFF